MTQITFSSDVNEVSTDSNADGSISWHVYEKDSQSSPGYKGIYLRREVNLNLEPEKQIVSIGSEPKIYFLVNQWILLFKFADRIGKVTYSQGEEPTLLDNEFNQNGRASSFVILNRLVIPTRIVFQVSASSSHSLVSFARMAAIGEASASFTLLGDSSAPLAFMGTRSASGNAILSSTTRPNLIIKASASGSFTLEGRALVFFAQAAANTGGSLDGVAFADKTRIIKSATADSSLILSANAIPFSSPPTNITPPEFIDSSVFNVGRNIEVTEGTWDGDPDPTI